MHKVRETNQIFFDFHKFYSVASMLIELSLPSFNNVLLMLFYF